MSDFLTWAFPIFAALALFALSYNALQTASRSGDYWMANVWFVLGILPVAARVVYWAATTNRNLVLRIIICTVVCGALIAITVEAFRSINHKRRRWLESSKAATVKAQPLVEEKQWHETPEYDLTPREVAQPRTVAPAKTKESVTPEPNLVFLRIARVSVYTNDNGTMVEDKNVPRTATWRLNHPTFVAMVATYHNQPTTSRKVGSANRVSAQLTYEFSGKNTTFHVPRALWFPQDVSIVDFGFNDSHGFVLAIVDHVGRLCAVQKGHGLTTKHDVLPANEANVQVRLISEADGVISKESKFSVQTTDNRFSGALVTEIS